MTLPPEYPEQEARLKDGRLVRIRHGRTGDEAAIARVIVPGFPIYSRAAGGNTERAIELLRQELEPQEFAVAILAESNLLIGATRMGGRGLRRGGMLGRAGEKLRLWGVYGLLCFALKAAHSRLFEPRPRLPPGELYKSLSAVDVQFQSLGVARLLGDFIEAYAWAAGYKSVSSMHRIDNLPVLAVQRRRGCTLIDCPPMPLARLFGYPRMVKSVKDVVAPQKAEG